MISCTKCKKATLPISDGGCIRTGGIVDIGCEYGEPNTLTNADLFRNMNTEDMADFIWDTLSGFSSYESLLAYLNEEVKE